MADEATQQMEVGASPEQTWRVLIDFDEYPTWATDLKSAEVVARDDEGRPLEVAFRAAAMGRSTSYRLRYDYSGAPEVLAWKLVEGDTDRTLVTYHLEVDLLMPLPGFVKRRAEGRIVSTALRSLRTHLEG